MHRLGAMMIFGVIGIGLGCLGADFGRSAKFNLSVPNQDPVDESRNLNCVLGEMQESVDDCDDRLERTGMTLIRSQKGHPSFLMFLGSFWALEKEFEIG